MKQYIQCKLKKKTSIQIVWIENKNIRPGVLVQLLPEGEYWKVLETYTILDEEQFKIREKSRRKGFSSIK